MKFSRRYLLLFPLLVFFFSGPSFAYTQCYVVNTDQSPDRIAAFGLEKQVQERWCYQWNNSEDGQELMVYNDDYSELRPELSALLKFDRSGKLSSLTQGSWLQGKLSFHTVAGENQLVEPFVAPLSMAEARQSFLPSFEKQSEQKRTLAHQMMDLLREKSLTVNSLNLYRVEPGNFAVQLPQDVLPWRGYWWPHAGMPLTRGSNAPLRIYDDYVSARTGRNPGAVAWEESAHAMESVSWAGHCNGWAASSVLHDEPLRTVYDEQTDHTIGPAQQKGMLAEASYCVHYSFYGSRYNGPSDNLRDIDADLFHKVLLYYIQHLGKPVAIDYVQDESVDNAILSAYRFEITAVPNQSNKFRVRATLKQHYYVESQSNQGGVAPHFNPVYEYYLYTDSSGVISRGEWISVNPDFLWVPLSESRCDSENPNIDHNVVLQIINDLPEAR